MRRTAAGGRSEVELRNPVKKIQTKNERANKREREVGERSK